MRLLVRTAVTCAVAFTISGSVFADDSTALPLRKAGQWQLKTVMDEGNGSREQALTMCIDATMEKNTMQASEADHKQSCTKYEIKKSDDAIIVDSTCTFNERNVDSHTELSGDFQKEFHIKITSTTSGTANGQSVSVKRLITQTGTYVGESCGDLKAGEAVGTDGRKIMVQ